MWDSLHQKMRDKFKKSILAIIELDWIKMMIFSQHYMEGKMATRGGPIQPEEGYNLC